MKAVSLVAVSCLFLASCQGVESTSYVTDYEKSFDGYYGEYSTGPVPIEGRKKRVGRVAGAIGGALVGVAFDPFGTKVVSTLVGGIVGGTLGGMVGNGADHADRLYFMSHGGDIYPEDVRYEQDPNEMRGYWSASSAQMYRRADDGHRVEFYD